MTKYYMGLSITYHDPALAILDTQGNILFAEATERYMQNKRALNCEADPLLWVQDLLKQYCPNPTEIVIAINWRKKRPYYENIVAVLGCLSASGLMKKGIKKLRSPLSNYQLHHMIACQRNKIQSAGVNLMRIIAEYYPQCSVVFEDYDHHLTHASVACYSSPFSESACAVIDSFGENGSMAFYHFKDNQLQRLYETKGTGSIGFYYMKITELCGFDWLKGEEWKVMGLAAYGKLNLEIYQCLKQTISVDGFKCQHHCKNLFAKLDALKKFKRHDSGNIEQAADLAFTGQYFFAELMTDLLQHLQQITGCENLAFAGGCALNSAYNGQITQRTRFQQVFIPSAPADDGTALGAAYLALHANKPKVLAKPTHKSWTSPYLGSIISDQSVQQLIQYNKVLTIRHLPDSICEKTAKLLSQGKLVGWIQGRAEFGPRALGNRSILADPRQVKTKDRINQRVKFREQFRPFAPSVLHQHAERYFEQYHQSPYMDKTLIIKAAMQKKIAAVCHADGTGRLQTVKQEWNPRFYQLINHFYQHTQIPLLLNTSFNIMGKPLVHSLEDAVSVFLTTGLDVLVINDYLISKADE
ncbi:MAG: nodulation protein nolNO [Methylococcales symbiont of Hymedesmia sp. n. MRB-2018]|nr:MAG: nodulation protein nolNO [Methylococcales symbiont of Hymedesmia sp. n. MRB-2018]